MTTPNLDLLAELREVETTGKVTGRRTSRVIVAIAHDGAQVLLCEESVALEFVREYGSGASVDGFMAEKSAVEVERVAAPGVYVGELRVVDGGPESWELPQYRDYYAEIRKLRPVTKEEWGSHLGGDWPEGWNEDAPAEVPNG